MVCGKLQKTQKRKRIIYQRSYSSEIIKTSDIKYICKNPLADGVIEPISKEESDKKTFCDVIKKEKFGAKRIDTVKMSDAKEWLIKLQDDGRGYSSIHSIRGVVRPAFKMAEDDNLIHKNPFEFQLATVVYNDSETREAITRKQERDFLKFIKEDKHFCKYYDAIYILFNTGLRISEFVGLTISDIEFDKQRIKVDHQLQRKRNMEYEILTPKTEKGERYVPMIDYVSECFRRIIENRKKPKVEPMIDGYCGFLCLDKNEMPMVASHWEKYFQHIREKYNSIYKVQMPCITPHVCRHTFCSKMAKSGMNPKTLQYIMGHSDIGVPLNTCEKNSFKRQCIAQEYTRKLAEYEALDKMC